jgi:hypothetical protein
MMPEERADSKDTNMKSGRRELPEGETIIPENGELPEGETIIPENGELPEGEMIIPENRELPDDEMVMPERGQFPEREMEMPEKGELLQGEITEDMGMISGEDEVKEERNLREIMGGEMNKDIVSIADYIVTILEQYENSK